MSSNVNNSIYNVSNDGDHCTNTHEKRKFHSKISSPVKMCDVLKGHCTPHIGSGEESNIMEVTGEDALRQESVSSHDLSTQGN